MTFLLEQTEAEQQDLAARALGTNLPLLTLTEGAESWRMMNRSALAENTHTHSQSLSPNINQNKVKRIDAGMSGVFTEWAGGVQMEGGVSVRHPGASKIRETLKAERGSREDEPSSVCPDQAWAPHPGSASQEEKSV